MKNVVQNYIRQLLIQLAPHGYLPILTDPIWLVDLFGYSDQAVISYVKNNSNLSLDIHHFTGHCKMAPLNEGGVVDGNALVYGTNNVYVLDNSICPEIPDINTAGPAMMIGLRGSQILKRVLQE